MPRKTKKNHSDKKSFLLTVPLFADLSPEEIGNVLPIIFDKKVKQGEILFREGDTGGELFIVESGNFSTIVHLPNEKEITIATFGQGDFFGEMSLFTDDLRSATCTAKIPSKLFCLTREQFINFERHFPYIASKIMYRMLNAIGDRLASTGDFLSDMVRWGENARKRSITDEFTDLFNRRFLDETLPNMLFQAKINKESLAIIMCDLDHFGKINSEYGHMIGDKVILAAVAAFREHFRDKDILTRYGGDEFFFILPSTDAKEALKIANRVIAAVNKISLLADCGGSITTVSTSQGLAVFPFHASSLQELMDEADKALYVAKKKGAE